MVQQISTGGVPAAAEIAGGPTGGVPPTGAPQATPADLDAAIQQQQGMPPEQKRQIALQKLLRLRAAIDNMIRILQGQQTGQPPGWMGGGQAQPSPTATPAWTGGGVPPAGGGAPPMPEGM